MLEVLPNSTLDGVNKNLGLTQALAKKSFKFFPSDKEIGLIFYLPLLLLHKKQGNILEKNGGKWHPILTLGPTIGKMVLTFLEEVIALQVSFTPVYVWKPGL